MAKKIIVVGAGIVGSAIAYHLAKAGAEVLVLDVQNAVGGLATPNSWAWINASWGNPEPYAKLRMRAMQDWRALASVHPDLGVNWCGGLLWDLPPEQLPHIASTQMSWGYNIEVLGRAEVAKREPYLRSPPEFALYARDEGSVEPVAATQAFLAAACAFGARLAMNTQVTGFEIKNTKVTGIRVGEFKHHADEVVIAAGVQTPHLLAQLDIALPIDDIAGLLVHSEPVAPILKSVVMAPELHVRQTREGWLVAGSDFGGTPLGQDLAAMADALIQKVRVMWRGAENLKLDFYSVGYRPTPQDGMPLIGRPSRVSGVYIAGMHSGVTLAPAVGKFAAAEILQDLRDPLLYPFHPDRVAS